MDLAEESFRSSFRETKASMQQALKIGCDVQFTDTQKARPAKKKKKKRRGAQQTQVSSHDRSFDDRSPEQSLHVEVPRESQTQGGFRYFQYGNPNEILPQEDTEPVKASATKVRLNPLNLSPRGTRKEFQDYRSGLVTSHDTKRKKKRHGLLPDLSASLGPEKFIKLKQNASLSNSPPARFNSQKNTQFRFPSQLKQRSKQQRSNPKANRLSELEKKLIQSGAS